MRPLALFRCDASAQIGAGHVSRCLSLAEALSEAGWTVRFAVSAETPQTVPEIGKLGFPLHILGTGDEIGAMRGEAGEAADLLVIDHYERDATFEKACRGFAHKILVFDDMTGRTHDCDVLLDAAASSAEAYRALVPPHASVLSGPDYAVVRRVFREARADALARRDGRPVQNILVSCGATDPANVTAAALDALAAWPDMAVTAVLSSKAPHLQSIRAALRPNVTLKTDVDNMAELMSLADVAIGTAGASAYERAVLGLPAILVTVADNQRGIAQITIAAGAAADAGGLVGHVCARIGAQLQRLIENALARIEIAQASSALVDGRGAIRVMLELLEASPMRDGSVVRLREATMQDMDWLLQLQRQPETRRHARNPAAPSPDEHRRWLVATLIDPARLLLIVETEAGMAGMIRLDARDGKGRYEVSIAVDSVHHGRGVATAALGLIRRLMPGAMFDAEILPSNAASLRLFGGAGYVPVGDGVFRSAPGVATHDVDCRVQCVPARA